MTTEFKMVPVDVHLEKAFDVIDGKHLPTIKITLPACNPDDTNAWDRRDAIGLMVKTMLSAAPTPPQPIYDEAKRIAELEQALAGMLFAFDDGVGLDWSEDLLDFARKLTPAVEFQSRAKAGKAGHE